MISDIHFAKKTYIEQHRQAFQDPTAILCKKVVTRQRDPTLFYHTARPRPGEELGKPEGSPHESDR